MKLQRILLLFVFLLTINNILIGQTPSNTFKNDGRSLKLNGLWQFSYAATLEDLSTAKDTIASVTNAWNIRDGKSRFGFGTYRTQIINSTETQLGILFPFMVVEYQIIANEQLVFESRNFNSSNPDKTVPGRVRAFFRLPPADTIDLQVIVKNFETIKSGINLPPVVNSYNELKYNEERRQVFEYSGLGILFIIALYNFILFGFLKVKSHLWLAILTIAIFMRGTVVYDGSFLLFQLFPNLSFELAKKIEYMSVYLTTGLGPLMYMVQFRIFKYRKVIYILNAVGLLMTLLVLFLPVLKFELMLDFFHVLVLIAIVICLDIVRIATINNLHTSKLVLIGSFLTSTLVILEIMKTKNILYIDLGSNNVNNAIVLYIFVQAVALSKQMARVYQENKYLNVHLEKSVELKTIELSEANSLKGKILSVVSHDLMNPLTNLKGTLDLLNIDALTPKDFEKMRKGISDQLSNNIILIEDVLNWSSLELKSEKSTSSQKICNIYEVVGIVTRQMKHFALEKRIKILSEVSKSTQTVTDKDAVVIILRNLISNAIKFTNNHGKVRVTEEVGVDYIKFGVLDNGIGIPDEMKRKIFSSSTTRFGTGKEKGRGVGLLIVKDLINQNGGKIWIEDNPRENGTAFYFTLLKHKAATI